MSSTFISSISTVLPGIIIPTQHANLKLGPGLLQNSNNSKTIVIRAGSLNHSSNGSNWWVDNNSRRYIPAAQESVIGVIVQKVGDGFRVDIGSAHYATLDGLAFEGATKRNKPNLKIGSLVYARVSLANKDMEPELECFDAKTRKACDFGEIKGGFLIKCSLQMCRYLLKADHFLLNLLGSRFALEVAVGMNGRVWINAKEKKQIVTISICIEAADPDRGGLDQKEIKTLLKKLDL